LCLALGVAGLGLPGAVHAGHLPLWELGIGIGTLSTPQYRGSTTRANFALPFPYAVYRGSFLQIDREDGIRGELFESEDVRFDLSLAGNVPVPDTDEGARSGMPGLDPLIEVGAELTYTLWRASANDHSFSINLPLRLVYSVGDPLLEFQGLTLSPYLNYRIRQEHETVLLRYNISVGPIFATGSYHDYFYQVAPQFATPQRPQYDARGGYGGSRVTLSATRHFGAYMMGAFARFDTLDGAVFEDSPLVETGNYFAFGLVFALILGESNTRVAH
jgi:outer membrane scaffolding protein for murein synthesis (MipA/OmpV family)